MPVDLIDPSYELRTAGAEGWEFHREATADLDGDGGLEGVHVIAAVSADDRGEFMWDDGQPWQVYVEEPNGEKTHVFARWVQLGDLRVMVTEQPDDRAIVILESAGAGLGVFVVRYRGPNDILAVEALSEPTNTWVVR